MAFKRYLIEFGQGADLHGEDNTGAAIKAVKDAMHHCCMAGVRDIFGLDASPENIRVDADIFAPAAESVNTDCIKQCLRWYDTTVSVHPGGASAKGLCVPEMGEGDHITIVLAVLTVYINIHTTNENG